jgi:serine protease Do
MRGIDLNVFDFDLTWAGFFMNADDYVYGRYGSRDEGPAEAGLSLDGLKYAMQQTLKAYQQIPRSKPTAKIAESRGLPTRVENYAAAKRVKKDACIHCHQVHNFQQELFWSKKTWTKDNMWLYPPPKSIGIELEVD